jgi:hypothetical protein
MTTSEAINEIAAACAKAQLELKPAAKDAENEGFKRNGKASKYSDLTAIIEAAHVYAKHNVAIFQDVTTSDAGVAVVTRLAHGSGQWLEFGPLTVPLGKRDAHGVGSATTYAKRYGLQAAALIPSDDDDGNGAVEAPKAAAVKSAPAGYSKWLMDLDAFAAKHTDGELISEIAETGNDEQKAYLRTDTATLSALRAKAGKNKKATVAA